MFYEALRMFRELNVLKPPLFFFLISQLVASGHLLFREAAEDTVLEIPKPHGQVGTTTIPIQKGVRVS